MLLEDVAWKKWERRTQGKNCSKETIYKAAAVVPERSTEACSEEMGVCFSKSWGLLGYVK